MLALTGGGSLPSGISATDTRSAFLCPGIVSVHQTRNVKGYARVFRETAEEKQQHTVSCFTIPINGLNRKARFPSTENIVGKSYCALPSNSYGTIPLLPPLQVRTEIVIFRSRFVDVEVDANNQAHCTTVASLCFSPV